MTQITHSGTPIGSQPGCVGDKTPMGWSHLTLSHPQSSPPSLLLVYVIEKSEPHIHTHSDTPLSHSIKGKRRGWCVSGDVGNVRERPQNKTKMNTA